MAVRLSSMSFATANQLMEYGEEEGGGGGGGGRGGGGEEEEEEEEEEEQKQEEVQKQEEEFTSLAKPTRLSTNAMYGDHLTGGCSQCMTACM